MSTEKTSNFNQAVWLGLSQLSSFSLSFVSAAILSRYFDKIEYGTYKQILYIYNIMFALFTAGLPSVFSYFIPRLNTGQQKALVNSLTRLFLILGFVFSISLFLLSDWLADVLGNAALSVGLKVFSLFPLFTLPAMGVEGIYTALKKTKTIAIYVLITKVLSLVFIISPVLLFNSSYLGAIIGWGIANFLIFLMAMYMKKKPYTKVTKELVPKMSKMILDYSLPLLGAFVAGFCINSADQFFVSRYYGTEAFAVFSNGNMNVPFAIMIAASVKNVLIPVLSKADADGRLDEIESVFFRAVSQSVKLIFPMVIYTMAFASYLMTFLYSTNYLSSTPYFQMHALRDIIGAIPYFSVLLAFGFSKFYMYIHMVGIVFVWGLDAIAVYVFHAPAYYIVGIQSALQFFIVISAFFYIHKKTHRVFMKPKLIAGTSKVLIHSTLIAIIAFCAINLFIKPDISSMHSLVAMAVGAFLFIVLLLPTGKLIKIDYLEAVRLLRHK